MPVAYLRLEQHLRWLRLRNLSPNTIRDRRQVLLRLGEWLGHMPSTATTEEISRWQEQLPVGPGTRARYFSHVRAYFAWLEESGIRSDNPARALVMPKLPHYLPRPIGTEDLFRAVAAAPSRVRPWLVLAGWMGFRCVEIALLRRECVFDRASQPYILVTVEATKGRYERVVPMCATVVAELAPVLPKLGWVFPRADGKPGPNRPGHVSKVGNEYLHSVGIPETMHSLRHWFGTAVLDGTGNVRVVQELLGHQSLQSTQVYTKVRDSSKTAAVSALPELRTGL